MTVLWSLSPRHTSARQVDGGWPKTSRRSRCNSAAYTQHWVICTGHSCRRCDSSVIKQLVLDRVWFGLLVFNGTFSTNRLYRDIGVLKILSRAAGQDRHIIEQWSNTRNQEDHKYSSAWLCGDDPLAMIRLPRGSLSSQSLGKYW